MLAVVDDIDQRAAVVESINTCLKAGADFDAAAAADSFAQGGVMPKSLPRIQTPQSCPNWCFVWLAVGSSSLFSATNPQ
jgi:hypothetical protein